MFSVAVSAADGAVYAGTEPSRLFRSRDGGESWEELEALQEIPSRPDWSFPPRPWTSHVRWIAPSPHDPELVLVGIELGGLMLTEDGGGFVQRSSARGGPRRALPGVAPTLRGVPTRPAATAPPGAATAAAAGTGRTPGETAATAWALTVDPSDPERWFVSAAPGPFEAHGSRPSDSAIYRWEGAGPWQVIEGPLDSHVYALAADNGQLFAGLGDGTLLLSEDGGESWSELGERIDGLTALAVTG